MRAHRRSSRPPRDLGAEVLGDGACGPRLPTLLEALQKSYNRPVIRLASEIGFEKVEERLIDYIDSIKTPLKEYPAQLLGAIELSVKELYEVYRKFIANQCQDVSKLAADGEDFENQNLLYLMSRHDQTTIRKVVGKHLMKMRFLNLEVIILRTTKTQV